MYLKQKKTVFIRKLAGNYGYIDNLSTHQDLILDEAGYEFLKPLSREGNTFEEIVDSLCSTFAGTDRKQIEQDALNFYTMLKNKGYIIIADSKEEADAKDEGFSYARLHSQNKKIESITPTPAAEQTTLEFLNKHLPNVPNLLSVQIECTSKCNERCVHCYIPHESKLKTMISELFYKIIDECEQMGVMGLTLSGGEPMLNPEFPQWLRELQKRDFYITILSNLTVLTDEIIEEMKKLNSVSVQVSLYSMVPQVHDQITKLPGSWMKTVNSILKLYNADIQVQVSCPSMKLNMGHYKDVIRWAHSLKMRSGTDYIIMARADHSTDNLENRLTLEDTEATIKDILENDDEYKELLLGYLKCGPKDRDTYANEPLCGVGMSFCEISAEGDVFPCAGWWDANLGNVSTQSLKDIWDNSPKLKEFRALRKKDMPECLDCKDRSFCPICMAKNANENEDRNPLKPAKHFCKVAELNHKIAEEWLKKHASN